MFSISPKTMNQQVIKLLEKMNSKNQPKIIPVKVDPAGKLDSCYYNVANKISRDGGNIHYGWTIWQTPNLIEAEHHAVWEKDGELLDISPRKEQYDTIMFVPDNDNIFNGNRAVPNVRLNTTSNALIDHFIIYSTAIDKLTGLGKRTDENTLLLLEPIVYKIKVLEIRKDNVSLFYTYGNTIESNCFCGKPKSYINCHGEGVDTLIDTVMNWATLLIKNNTK